MTARAVEVRHGYTLTDLERLAKIAVARDFWHQGMHPADRYDLSFSAMAEHLYAADQRPTANDLFSAATTAVRRQAQTDRSAHGTSNTDVYAGAPNFYRYWWDQFGHVPGPEDRVVDRTALWQILDALAPRLKKTLLALATHDKAAASLGITRATYFGNLSDARRAFYQLWHEGGKPSRLWAADRRGTNGTRVNVMDSIVRRRTRKRTIPASDQRQST